MTPKHEIELLHANCMDYMSGLQDNAFDLAIVDPPYFDGPQKANFYRNGAFSSTNAPAGEYKTIKEWMVPGDEYFSQLLRVSKNQIIWGVNYFPKMIGDIGRIVWDKENGASSFSDGEIASCSLIESVRFYRYRWNGMLQENMKNKEVRIHPTQKPISLYEWQLLCFAKQGDRILDTHLGSGSSAIAADKLGFDFVGMELDADYYAAACKRFEQHKSQGTLFSPDHVVKPAQEVMFA